MQAMIFAAGKGTRLKPLTDIIPKAMVPVGDIPLIQRVVRKLVDAGADDIVVNVHHHAPQLIDYLQLLAERYRITITISDESQELLETGGGIKKAQQLFPQHDAPILIHNCDILSNVDLAEFYKGAQGNDATLLVSSRNTQRYLLFNDDMRLVGWTNIATGELKTPFPSLRPEECTMLAFSGIHCVAPSVFPVMQQWPDRFPIMDFYLRHCDTLNIRGVAKDDLRLLDVGKLYTLSQAEQFLHLCKK